MAYDEELADRIRALVSDRSGIGEMRMFGGLAFLVGGHMAVAVSGQGGLMVRVDPARSAALRDEPGTEPMIMRGRAMDGWLRVRAGAVDGEAQLRAWVDRGVAYAGTLPPK